MRSSRHLVAKNRAKRYPPRPFQPALKPILERFDFVKSSRDPG